jgi:hypothetical protein
MTLPNATKGVSRIKDLASRPSGQELHLTECFTLGLASPIREEEGQ